MATFIVPPDCYPKKQGETLVVSVNVVWVISASFSSGIFFIKPTYTLTEDQKETLAVFQERMSDLTGKAREFCDDAELVRYLRARDYKVDAAEKLLRETLKWRETSGVEEIKPEDIYLGEECGLRFF